MSFLYFNVLFFCFTSAANPRPAASCFSSLLIEQPFPEAVFFPRKNRSPQCEAVDNFCGCPENQPKTRDFLVRVQTVGGGLVHAKTLQPSMEGHENRSIRVWNNQAV